MERKQRADADVAAGNGSLSSLAGEGRGSKLPLAANGSVSARGGKGGRKKPPLDPKDDPDYRR